MKKLKLLILTLILLSFWALAHDAGDSQDSFITSFLSTAQQWKEQELPGALGTFAGNVRSNIYLTLDDGHEYIFHLVTEDKKFKLIEPGELSDPTIKVYTSEAVLKEIITSSQPRKQLMQSLHKRTITYDGVGFVHKLKFSVLFLLSKLSKDTSEEKSIKLAESPAESADDSSPAPSPPPVKESAITGSVTAEIEPVKPKTTTTHPVDLTNLGFEPATLNIKVGDKVVWQNVRTAKIDTAMVLGTQKCGRIKSKIIHPGEIYSWAFTEPGTCFIADGIYTLSSMKIVVNK